MNKSLQKKLIVITGASGGLGEQLARISAKEGARLILMARRIDRLEAVKKQLVEDWNAEVYIFELDVANLDAVERVFRTIEETIGVPDVLVNNAGFGVFKKVEDIDLKEAKSMLDVNVLGLMATTRLVLPAMQKRGSGHIINIASQAGKMATPKSSVYSATKHAVLGFTNSLRMELHGTGIFVTAVNPGPIDTNFFIIADESGTYVKNIQKFMLNSTELAEQITKLMLTNKRELNRPRYMSAASVLYGLFPRLVETLGRGSFNKK